MAEHARGAMTGQQDIDTEGMAPERGGAPSQSNTSTVPLGNGVGSDSTVIDRNNDFTSAPIANDSERNPGAASEFTHGDGMAAEVPPRPVGTGAWPGEPSHEPRGSREAVDENRPADITSAMPTNIPGAHYQPRPQDRGNVIVPEDRVHPDTAGQTIVEDLDEEPSVQQGAQP